MSEWRGVHPRSLPARPGSLTSRGGSPGRLGPIWTETFLPVTPSAAPMISFTERPAPVPRFSALLGPPSRSDFSARTWASARSVTWM